jgi:subtilisin-like proprotein convertase family protein
MRMGLWLGLLTFTMSLGAQTEFQFSDGGRRTALVLAGDEVYSSKAAVRQARGVKEWGSGTLYQLDTTTMKGLRSSRAGRTGILPVFYDKSNLPAAEKLAAMSAEQRAARMAAARRVMTAKLLVHMDASRLSELAETRPTGTEKSYLPGWTLVTYDDAFAALDAAEWLAKKGGFEFTPVFARQTYVRQTLQRTPNDPLYPKQWHLDDSLPFNIGMKNAWDLATGKGINMAVIDDALDLKHEDLTNVYPLESGYHRNFKEDGERNDPNPMKASENHGTYCGGLAMAAGFNNTGVIGVAPESRAMGLRMVGGATPDDAAQIALGWQPEGILTHVSSNSWGPSDDGKDDGRVSALQLAGMLKGVTENRERRGTVFAISCGNGRDAGDDASYDAFSGSRFGIAVAAVARDGKQSSYSESGMSVAIAAFGGEFQPPEVLWSTNVSGEEAFNIKAEGFPTTEAPINYTDSANGTSSAAPQVSGAAALLLELNPNLGYRDVKEILMRTAVTEGLQGTDEFRRNAGGFSFSHAFGAGLLNVSAALAAAREWVNLGELKETEYTFTGPNAIPDDGTPFTMELNFNAEADKLRVEHVELTVNVKHKNRGDLQFTIESPSGFQAIAAPRKADDNADFTDYVFTSPRFWGESAQGVWKVLITDKTTNEVVGTVENAKLKVYGTVQQ